MADELTITQRAVVGDMRQKLKKMGDPRADDKSAIVKILEISRPKLFPSKKEDGGKVENPKKYKGPLPKPKPKPTFIEKVTGKRSKIKPMSKEEEKYIGDKMAGKVVEKMNKGGAAVPSEFKGFSKLPEAVQVKMDPVAAKKYNGGGAVRGMGRAYMGSSRKAKIR